MNPRGMREQKLLLSTFHEGQAEAPGLDAVRTVVYSNLGDGWVINEWPSRHLAGLIIQKRRRETTRGVRYQRERLDIDSAILQNEIVEASTTREAERIAGGANEDDSPKSGWLEQLDEQRQRWLAWLSLTDLEKASIHDFVTGVTGDLEGSTNPLNVLAYAKAKRMEELPNNPSADLALSHPLEGAWERRYSAVMVTHNTNAARMHRLRGWLFEENRHVANANSALNDLAVSPDDEAFDYLLNVTRHIRFRVQPFNQLAHAIHRTGNHGIEDPAVIETTQAGIQFQRLRNYFLKPFRQLISRTLTKYDAKSSSQMYGVIPEIEERLDALETVQIGEPYAHLIGRLLVAGSRVSENLHRLNPDAAQHAANVFKQLIIYHCLPEETDDIKEPWYRYQLR
jgi:hypothetical protein